MEIVGQQMVAKPKLIGAMHHSEQVSKALMLVVVKFQPQILAKIVLLISTGGIRRSFGGWILYDKDNMNVLNTSI